MNQEGLKKITEGLLKLIDQYKYHFVPKNIFTEYHDVGGDIVDVEKYLINDPECMINFGTSEVKQAINVFYSMGDNSNNSEVIELLGQIIYCLNNILKEKTINFYAVFNNKDRFFYLIPVILSGSNLLTPQIELVLLNQKAFFRRVGFALMEGAPDKIREDIGIYNYGGYGHAKDINKNIIIDLFKIIPDVIISKEIINPDSIEYTCTKVIEALVNGFAKNDNPELKEQLEKLKFEEWIKNNLDISGVGLPSKEEVQE